MLLKILVEIVLIWLWAFHTAISWINTPKNLVIVSLSRAFPSMKSSGNFVGMKRYLEVGWKIVHLVLSVLIELQSNFIEIKLWHGCSPVNLLHIFRISFPMNTSGGLLQTNDFSSNFSTNEKSFLKLFTSPSLNLFWVFATYFQCFFTAFTLLLLPFTLSSSNKKKEMIKNRK